MSLVNFISRSISDSRVKKDVKRLCEGASQSNFTNRGVMAMPYVDTVRLLLVTGAPEDNDIYDYQSESDTPGIDFIWGERDAPENVLVSGGTSEMRTPALLPFLYKCLENDIPVVALHTGNHHLEDLLKKYSADCELVSSKKMYYDAFRAMPVPDMAHILYETMEDANPNVTPLLHALLEMVLRTEGSVNLQNLASFPLARLMDKLNELKARGEITTDEYDEIGRDYMAGSSEVNVVRTFLAKLARQADAINGKVRSGICNVKKILKKAGAICIDVGIGNNDLLIALIIHHLMLLQSAGRDFAIIIDGIAISKCMPLCDLLQGRVYAVSHNDFVASLFGGDHKGEDLFARVAGEMTAIVLFGHKSGTSCQKWSEHLGRYHKIRVRMNVSQGDSFFTDTNTRGNTRSMAGEDTEEPRVRAESISMLPEALACIYVRNEILFSKM